MQTGKINVTSENIFPIIKKFLYSDHEIFLRELVSNAVDAVQKLKTLASVNEFGGELGDLTIRVAIDKNAKTITVSDRGIGMTAEEVEKYINQIAFSGAEEFLAKYKDKTAIIGHFGLGFYSSFMVAKKVEIITRSYKTDSTAVRWICDGTPDYTIEPAIRDDRGTDVILHIDDESVEFIEEDRISGLLKKYCRFLPVAVCFGKEKEWKDGKYTDTEKDHIVNDTNPLWTRNPQDLKDEDYSRFYHDLYPMHEDPLFHIHLFVDYPFHLTGVLYFPKIKNNIDIHRNKIQLYCNQVFVTDSVEGVVPEFLTLLHGVIDSPDIPLNISRSYLQSDANVKKISAHISKKVADKLQDIFKNNRNDFEQKWDALKIFMQYGMLTDEKFYERAEKFCLLKNTDGKYFTIEEYLKLIKETQTNKEKHTIVLYATNTEEQHVQIENAKARGYDVLLMDGQLDTHFINQYEQKNKEVRFNRVDADITDKLIEKESKEKLQLSPRKQTMLTHIFNSQLPAGKSNFYITFEPMKDTDEPLHITRNEFMRRMKEMSALGGGMGFYGEMPDSYNLAVNASHTLITRIADEAEKNYGEKFNAIEDELAALKKERSAIEKQFEGKKEEEKDIAQKDRLDEIDKKTETLNNESKSIMTAFAADQPLVRQLIDLALLANNMLKGEDLAKFVRRSVEIIK